VTAVSVVVPVGIDDPARVSGGNRYDRRVCDALRDRGWTVREVAVPGTWPRPDPEAPRRLARSLDALPDGAAVLVDGLIASAAAAVLVPRAARLRLVVLVHMVFGGDAVPERDEAAVLTAARAVVTTSGWTRSRLCDRYRLPADGVHVARPGTDPADPGSPSRDGGRLLCVGTVSRLKGQDLLVTALAGLGPGWRCRLVGPTDRDPGFAQELARRIARAGLGDRVRFAGLRTGAELDAEYRDADLLVVPSRTETYGMVVAEALATGLPVFATAVGGVSEALGCTAAGVPGLLVPAEDAAALTAALRQWLAEVALRDRLRRAALLRRETLTDWSTTGEEIAAVLRAVCAEPERPHVRGPG
jgi:glycosyltransferase involved in cell wall biosynthesis